jgi:hypothetical protein
MVYCFISQALCHYRIYYKSIIYKAVKLIYQPY